jgi:8-oxo-dGTP pyrophosphatase MutT (NUDIX family)
MAKPKRKGLPGRQFAALPMKEAGDETLVLLVTSRDTGRWVLPKGWAEKRLSGKELAAKEAYEEAGIKGQVVGRAIGSYTYDKGLPGGGSMECLVDVFPMRVTRFAGQMARSQAAAARVVHLRAGGPSRRRGRVGENASRTGIPRTG